MSQFDVCVCQRVVFFMIFVDKLDGSGIDGEEGDTLNLISQISKKKQQQQMIINLLVDIQLFSKACHWFFIVPLNEIISNFFSLSEKSLQMSCRW